MKSIKEIHPVAALFCFVGVIVITVFFSNPWLTALSLVGGFSAFCFLEKRGKILKESGFYILIITVTALINPLFSHRGATPLFFINNNPITLEALLYGAYLGTTVVSVMLWFRCFNTVITEDKLLYLIGRISPKTALLLSTALRYIPLLKLEAEKIRQVQKTTGLYAVDSAVDKLKGGCRVFSALVGRSLENALDTGMSMKARGYGLNGRTNFSLYTFKKSDIAFLTAVILLNIGFCAAAIKSDLNITFYPQIIFPEVGLSTVLGFLCFGTLALLPFFTELKEALAWKYYKSKI